MASTGRFKRHCSTSTKHSEWGFSDANVVLRKSTNAIRDKLLLTIGRSLSSYNGIPMFCELCIGKGQQLLDEDVTASHSLCSEREEQSTSVPKRQRTETEVEDEAMVCLSSVNLPGDCSEANEEVTSVLSGGNELQTEHPKDLQNLVGSVNSVDDLAFQLGRHCADSARKEAKILSGKKSMEDIVNLSVQSTLSTNNNILVNLVRGLQSYRKTAVGVYQAAKVVENLLNLTAYNVSLPIHFRESILLYTLTGSKNVLRLLGSSGAHASYTAVKKWLSALSDNPVIIPHNDCVVAFDNNQVIKRRWKVKLKNSVHCNVVTVVVVFNVQPSTLQCQPKFLPSLWMTKTLTADEIECLKQCDMQKDVRLTHRKHLHVYLKEQLAIVIKEQKQCDGATDAIDAAVTLAEKAKTCYNCEFDTVPVNCRKCPSCHSTLTASKMRAFAAAAEESEDEGPTTETVPKSYEVILWP